MKYGNLHISTHNELFQVEINDSIFLTIRPYFIGLLQIIIVFT